MMAAMLSLMSLNLVQASAEIGTIKFNLGVDTVMQAKPAIWNTILATLNGTYAEPITFASEGYIYNTTLLVASACQDVSMKMESDSINLKSTCVDLQIMSPEF